MYGDVELDPTYPIKLTLTDCKQFVEDAVTEFHSITFLQPSQNLLRLQ